MLDVAQIHLFKSKNVKKTVTLNYNQVSSERNYLHDSALRFN